ncbi:unnamed protein product [Rotaria socialis]|uniref:Uncharacterized protein n=1 Tax=Rotaria socialis TaxID=392032 RepID=A0A820LLN8_9BILA|nr:unnamed protein product [Rotaria socialis]CAF3386315.1 unnamed protein product [Rotaria socialis]CAF3435645.1 unnamed protein product [Rotaria socialis]CAF3602357.1 unnamed protein product [Rotaria socialis]CAF3710333.1 unnamed protein product [Rotaria socialis]
MGIQNFCYSLLILFLILNGSIEVENSIDKTTTTHLTSITAATTTSSSTNQSTLLLCPNGHVDPPKCTQCSSHNESNGTKCLENKNHVKPSSGTGHRASIIVLVCLLSAFAIFGMLAAYARVNRQRRHRPSSNAGATIGSSTNHTTITNRFSNILRSIGLNNPNKRPLFSFLSNSNNNNSSEQYRPPAASHTDLNENLDEALLFDDPYVDGGLSNPSVNPYKSLTLAIT